MCSLFFLAFRRGTLRAQYQTTVYTLTCEGGRLDFDVKGWLCKIAVKKKTVGYVRLLLESSLC